MKVILILKRTPSLNTKCAGNKDTCSILTSNVFYIYFYEFKGCYVISGYDGENFYRKFCLPFSFVSGNGSCYRYSQKIKVPRQIGMQFQFERSGPNHHNMKPFLWLVRKRLTLVGYEIITAVSLKMAIFWVVGKLLQD